MSHIMEGVFDLYTKKEMKSLAITVILGLILWFCPHPDNITAVAWHLFAIFASTIVGFILQPFPIGAVAFMGITTAALTGVISVNTAISGFGNSTIWLIVCAFLLARAFIKSGLGSRIAYLIIRAIGKSSLTLGYAITLRTLSYRRQRRQVQHAPAALFTRLSAVCRQL